MNFLLPFLFTALGFGQLSLLNGWRWEYGAALGTWLACFGLATYLLRRRLPLADPYLLPLVSLLAGLGLLMVARLAPRFLLRQTVWLAVSTVALLAVTLVPRNLAWLRRYKYTWLLAGLALLATTLVFGVNPSGAGARLWLGAGGVYFQPSEPLKILLVVFLAVYLSDRRRPLIEVEARLGRLRLPHPAYLGPMLTMWGFSILLLFWQRDLGAALLFFCTFLAMLYAAVGRAQYVLVGLGLLLAAGVIGYRAFDYVALRIEGWWNPWLDPAGRSFQIVQSLLAFAEGGWFGQGLGQGLPTAIPVVHTDFVFAAVAEEYGLLGALGVLLAFGLIVHRAFQIALRCETHFRQLLATGLGFLIGLQTLVIAAGALKLIPLTGVTLPFVSYGGSSLLTSFVMVGLLLFMSAQGVR
ncbi:MAG: FtsW/RodA/SpoVE family cell cycle protein [Caldilineae bacterium]|nr:MAG: FtsW/RodA/SpoVE family cell cycle protein [Caldilineae bacterium]